MISKATLNDIPQLSSLINSAYRGESSKKGWTTEADLLGGIRIDNDSLQQMMHKENSAILKFCDEHNEIKGCVYLEKKNDKMYVGLLTVSPMLQAKGIGKKLLFAAEEFSRDNNYYAMQMTVISVRDELIKWYERHGYCKTGETLPFPADEKSVIQKQPLEFVVMEKRFKMMLLNLSLSYKRQKKISIIINLN